ncbi:MAG: LuxR C-terminal-related transcriptional regulator, partial [Oscillibacter sp.]
KIVYNLFGKTESCMLYTVPLTGLAVATVGVSIPGELGALLTMNMFSFTTLVFCGLYGYLLKRKTGCYENAARYKVLMGVMGGSSILAILENIIYVFWANVFVDELLPFYENQINFFEDGFCLILSVWLVLFTKKEREKYMSQKIETILQQRMNEFQVRQQEKSKMVGKEQLVEFCKYYGLTERETEILRLILEGKSNQELSEELYITVGTVKAHAHSIFGKLEVSRRSQLMTMFMNYGTK